MLSVAPLPSQGPTASFAELKRRAEEAHRAGRTEEQVSLYRKAVALRPEWGEGWWYLGTGLYELRRYSEALTAFQRLSRITATDGQPQALIGLCEFQLRRYQDALQHLFRAEQLGTGDNREMALTVRYHIAILLSRGGQFEWARDMLATFAWIGDASPPIIEAVGINTLRIPILPSEISANKRDLIVKAGQASWEPFLAGHPGEAERIFKELVAQYPKEPNLHYAYGVRLLDTDPEGALREFQQELEINPSQVVARVQIVFLNLKQGEPEKALPQAREAVRLVPSYFLAHNALGRVYLALGQIPSAVQELQAAVRLEPQSPENHFDLAEAYRAAGRKTDAARERAEFERIKKAREPAAGPANTAP
ncbi:MAG TPA: tetratricopeptide repeat protein [Terriglobales bacterium]|nr:tetratricopeptide repeat protein [Terriglobales bacterium]